MVSREEIVKQLTNIRFNYRNWNRAEAQELENIILPGEHIFECVNGWYQGGGALLVATNLRVLLIDKKIMNYLAVEDVRFDTIAQIDYGHRFLDAHIGINTGLKELKFRSYNKIRLRNLISLVQKRMAEIKLEQEDHSDSQRKHLMQIDQKLNEYLQHQQIQGESFIEHIKGPGNLSIKNNIDVDVDKKIESDTLILDNSVLNNDQVSRSENEDISRDDLYKAGVQEVFSKNIYEGDLNDDQNNKYLRIAYAKLPMFLKDRKKALSVYNHSTMNVNFKSVADES